MGPVETGVDQLGGPTRVEKNINARRYFHVHGDHDDLLFHEFTRTPLPCMERFLRPTRTCIAVDVFNVLSYYLIAVPP